MTLKKLVLPAYVTVAFDISENPRVKIQELTEREVVFENGVPTNDGILLPPRLIIAPQPNDVITATIEEALGHIGAASLIAIAEANEAKVAADIAKSIAEERLAELGGDVFTRLEKKVAMLEADIVTKDATAQTLLARIAEIESPVESEPSS